MNNKSILPTQIVAGSALAVSVGSSFYFYNAVGNLEESAKRTKRNIESLASQIVKFNGITKSVQKCAELVNETNNNHRNDLDSISLAMKKIDNSVQACVIGMNKLNSEINNVKNNNANLSTEIGIIKSKQDSMIALLLKLVERENKKEDLEKLDIPPVLLYNDSQSCFPESENPLSFNFKTTNHDSFTNPELSQNNPFHNNSNNSNNLVQRPQQLQQSQSQSQRSSPNSSNRINSQRSPNSNPNQNQNLNQNQNSNQNINRKPNQQVRVAPTQQNGPGFTNNSHVSGNQGHPNVRGSTGPPHQQQNQNQNQNNHQQNQNQNNNNNNKRSVKPTMPIQTSHNVNPSAQSDDLDFESLDFDTSVKPTFHNLDSNSMDTNSLDDEHNLDL